MQTHILDAFGELVVDGGEIKVGVFFIPRTLIWGFCR